MMHDDLMLDRIASPLGEILYVADEAGVTFALDFADYAPRMHALLQRYATGRRVRDGVLPWARDVLARYFAGEWGVLDDLPVHAGGTALQCRVWQALRTIPAGATCSYAELARTLGQAKAVRAVASANARNPIAILVPCHRVVGHDGQLTGYAGGLWRKAWLLKHESSLGIIPKSYQKRPKIGVLPIV